MRLDARACMFAHVCISERAQEPAEACADNRGQRLSAKGWQPVLRSPGSLSPKGKARLPRSLHQEDAVAAPGGCGCCTRRTWLLCTRRMRLLHQEDAVAAPGGRGYCTTGMQSLHQEDEW